MRQVLLIFDAQPCFNPPAWLVVWQHHFGNVVERAQVIATTAS
ncbi:hypothetical protein [Pseudomonas sp. 1152_12]